MPARKTRTAQSGIVLEAWYLGCRFLEASVVDILDQQAILVFLESLFVDLMSTSGRTKEPIDQRVDQKKTLFTAERNLRP